MIKEDVFLDRLVPIFLSRLSQGDDNYSLIQAPFDQDSPKSAYATIQIIDIADVGQMWEGDVTGEGQEVKQDVNIGIRMNTYGIGAVTTLRKFQQTLQFPSMSDQLNTIKACWRGDGNVINLTPLIKTSYQERATLDITIGTAWLMVDDLILPVLSVQTTQTLTP